MITLEFESEIRLYDRLHDAAKSAGCTVKQVIRALLVEALNDRECAATIRQADEAPFPSVLELAEKAGKVHTIDMRFCSPHCPNLYDGMCYNPAVLAAGEGILVFKVDGERWFVHELCPYPAAEFERWQREAK